MTNRFQRVGLWLGPLLFIAIFIAGEVFSLPGGMTRPMIRTAAVVALMAVWWVTEAIPIPATSLLPIGLFPLLGILSSKEATAPYANHLIYLFMGGFFMAMAMERWGIHKRIALQTIHLVGISPKRVVLGFMVATGALSMWVSNTATAMMMLPVGLAVLAQVRTNIEKCGNPDRVDLANFRFGTALMLGIAYAASIGGVATLIGTPPNTVLAAVIDQKYGVSISFLNWMKVGLPLSVAMLVLAWGLLVKVLYPPEIGEIPGGKALIEAEIAELGPMSRAEKRLVVILLTVALAWIARGLIPKGTTLAFLNFDMVHDSTIAMLGAVAMFLIPGDKEKGFLLDWATAVKIPWGVVVLFGGGLSLSEAVSKVKLANWLAEQMGTLQAASLITVLIIVTLFTIFLTEITSNTATATLLMPLMAGLAETLGLHPYVLMVPAAIACSYAFMLPVATPPNAVVYGSGYISIAQMCKAGFILNLVAAVLIILIVLLLPVLWGIDLHSILPTAAK